MNEKRDAVEFIERLPEGTSLETILAEPEFKLLVERRIAEVDSGDVMTHEQALESLSKWLTSSGMRTQSAT